MINMMRAELYRLSKSKGLYICLFLLLFTYGMAAVLKAPGGISLSAMVSFDKSSDVKLDINQISFNYTYYFAFIGLVFSAISVEFSEKTVKNTLTSVTDKSRYFIAKFTGTVVFGLYVYIVMHLLYYIVNRIVNGTAYSSDFGSYAAAMAKHLPIMIAILSIFSFLAFFFRKGALFNTFAIGGPVLYTTVALTLYSINATQKIAEKLLEYELGSMLSKIVLDSDSKYLISCFTVCSAVTLISFFLGWLSFTRRETD
ncbi:MAG: ABC transporter permease [Ruminococcus sp.]|nr:ABC transporter permease [Ruminococcus sp.]